MAQATPPFGNCAGAVVGVKPAMQIVGTRYLTNHDCDLRLLVTCLVKC